MALTIDLSIHVDATDPDVPEAVELALDIVAEEAHGYAEAIRRRLQEAGIDVLEIGVKRGTE